MDGGDNGRLFKCSLNALFSFLPRLSMGNLHCLIEPQKPDCCVVGFCRTRVTTLRLSNVFVSSGSAALLYTGESLLAVWFDWFYEECVFMSSSGVQLTLAAPALLWLVRAECVEPLTVLCFCLSANNVVILHGNVINVLITDNIHIC